MKTIIGIIAAVVLVGAVGGFIVMNKDDDSKATNTSTQTSQSEDMSSMGTPSSEQTTTDESENVSTSNVVMSNLDFSPAKISVKKGTTVTWTNRDNVQHDVNPDNPTNEFKKSPLFGKDGTYSVTFNTVGSFSYHCTPHPFMKGTVEVTE